MVAAVVFLFSLCFRCKP